MPKTKITQEFVKGLRPQLNEAVAALGEKYGLVLEFGDAKFDDASVTFKLEISHAPTADFDPAKNVWDTNCAYIGMKPEDYGQQTFLNGTAYTICGYRKNARAYCVLVQKADGSKAAITPEDAKKGLASYTLTVGSTITIHAWGKFSERKMTCVAIKEANGDQPPRFVFDNETEWTWFDLNSNFSLWNRRNGYTITAPNGYPVGGDTQQSTSKTANESTWQIYCRSLGMELDDLGKHFVFQDNEYEITGCNPRARRYTIFAKQCSNGKEYRFDPEDIKECMGD